MRIGKGMIVLLVLVFSATSAMAGGFRLPEAGAKAMGMGFAFTAQADDPSAIYFNPAGITQLQGSNIKGGITYVKENGGTFSGTTPRGSGTETQKDLNFFIPNLFFTKGSKDFAYGVGVFSPFGLGQEYQDPANSLFRNQITKINLMTVVVNPTVAWKINEFVSVGAGIDYMYGTAVLEKTPVNAGLGGNLYNSKLEGSGDAWGYNFGILVTPSKDVKVGFSYRSPFALNIPDGDVEIRNINAATSAAFFGSATSFDTKGSATINMPATATLGVAYIMNKLTLEADADWTFWHSFKTLDVTLKDQRSPVLVNTVSPKNWKDVVAFYLGAEYRVTDPLALRLGFRYDPTPVPATTMGPELPDSNKMYYSAGAGYKFKNWTFDLAYMYVDKQDRTVSNIRAEGANSVGSDGTWSGDAHLVAFDVGYKF